MITARVQINGHTIAEIGVTRQPPYTMGLEGVNEYLCVVCYTGNDGYDQRAEFYIEHTYADGPLVLTAKAMLESVNQFHRLPVRK